MYSQTLGRFTSVDPIFMKVDRLIDPQRINLYVYVRNAPLKYRDPTGRDIVLGSRDPAEQKVLKQALVEIAKTEKGRAFLTKLDKMDVVFSVSVGKAVGNDRRQSDTYGRENYGKTDKSKLVGSGENAKGTITIEINVNLIKRDAEQNKKNEEFNKNLGEHAAQGGKEIQEGVPQGKNDNERNATVLGHELNDADQIVNTGRAPADSVSTAAARSMIEDRNSAKGDKAEKFVDALVKPKEN